MKKEFLWPYDRQQVVLCTGEELHVLPYYLAGKECPHCGAQVEELDDVEFWCEVCKSTICECKVHKDIGRGRPARTARNKG